MTPRVSIVLPAYNSAKFIEETIDSLLSQSFTNFECVVVNDSSTDATEQIVTKLSEKDSRIRLISNSLKRGIAGALNTGLAQSRGEYIARADADDIYLPERLEKQVRFLDQNPGIALLGTAYAPFNQERILEVEFTGSPTELAWKFISNTYFCHPSVMFRKKVFEELGGYPDGYNAEDYEYFSRIVYKYPCSNLSDILIHYRQHQDNLSSKDPAKMQESVDRTSCAYFSRFSTDFRLIPVIKTLDQDRTINFIFVPRLLFFFHKFIGQVCRNYNQSIFSFDVITFCLRTYRQVFQASFALPYRNLKYHTKKLLLKI